ncbi:CHAT domain-containing protein [Rhodobacter aestuarii]|uniref:CHAT domain-containing protein n=1 Tax=Rhodobacter aestuarii TaxID=453582 RepID=A0A1N7IWD2_9RHOB|nr:CHAT domain-containing protein [Rhodobacter aestuarii]PTV97466.1 CHAT domain-containing protein [Rhodobacter aestuarii]SIS41354.1 CHAT domain-containing protein [Rhodobacter aestuarii]
MPRFLPALLAALCLTPLTLTAQTAFAPDPTGAVSAEGVYAPKPIADLAPAFQGAVAKEDDPRIGVWIALRTAGDLDGLIGATEADLRSAAPHPSASHVWAWAQWAKGALGPTALPRPPADLAATLTLAAQAFQAVQMGRDDLLAGLAEATLARPRADYWADYEIAYAACGVGLRAECLAVAERLVETFPADFGAAFLLGGTFIKEPAPVIDWLDAHPGADQAPGGALIRALLARPDTTAAEMRDLSALWLAAAPNDPNALRRLGAQQGSFWRHEAALEDYRREEAAYPFRDATARVARALAALGRFEEARQTAEAAARASQPEAAQAAWAGLIALRGFDKAGALGEARAAGLAALEAAPDLRPLLVAFGEMLTGEGFPGEAVPLLTKAVAQDPRDSAAVAALMQALDTDGRPQDALEALKAHRAAGGLPSDAAFNTARKILAAQGDRAGLDALLVQSRAVLPHAVWLHGNFAYDLSQQDRAEEAFETIRDAVLRDPFSDWRLARLVDYAAKADRMAEAADLLEAVVARYPDMAEAWAQLGRATKQDLSIWERARAAAPRAAFPEVRGAKALAKAAPDDWQGVIGSLDAGLARLEAAGAEAPELAAVLEERAGQVDDAVYAGRMFEPARIEQALADLDRARALGLGEDRFWKLRYFLLGRVGPSQALTLAALENQRTHPDDEGAVGNLYKGDVQQNLGGGALAFVAHHAYVERRPRDAKRLSSFAHRHNKWGGSPVVALAYLERAKRWDPEASVKVETDHAYKTLGAYKRHYAEQYDKGVSVSESDLYISWFESARADTRKPQPTIRQLDLSAMRVSMIQPDGTEWEAEYHPVIGRLTRFKVGRVEGGIDYNAEGNVERMFLGDRVETRLIYAPRDPESPVSPIIRMESKGNPALSFDYNAAGKPTRIEVEGMGRLLVSYDAAGDIADTQAQAPDGSEGGQAITAAVLRAFSGFQEVLGNLRDIQRGDFSGLQVDDPELSAMQTRLEEANEDETVSMLAYRRLEMELAQMLLARLGDLPAHAQRAESLLSNIYFSARYAEDEEDTTPEDAAALQVLGLEAVSRWRTLAALIRPEGLPEDRWSEWEDMRDWAMAVAPLSPEATGAQARFGAELAQGGLRLLSEAGWLRASALTNPGFWRSYPRAEVFPRALVERGLSLSDLVIRANGDVVVGSDRGLAVFRRGFWEWFGFDRAAGAFSASLEPAKLDPHSAIAALAEDDLGRLWLATRAGLVMLAQDYSAPAQLWKTDDPALPEGPLAALAVNGPRMALGNGAGLVIWDLERLSELERRPEAIETLRPARDGFLALGRVGLSFHGPRGAQLLTDFRVTDALAPEHEDALYLIAGEELLRADWPQTGREDAILAPPGAFAPVAAQETIARTDAPLGLAELTALPARTALTVLTDQGGAVMGRSGFEPFSEPGRDRLTGLLRAVERDGQLWMLTSEGVAAVVRGQARLATEGRVDDLLTFADLGVTFVAGGGSLEVIHHDDLAAGAQFFAPLDAHILRRAPDGALITHSGNRVMRFAPGATAAEELFAASQTVPGDRGQGPLRDILAAKDGSIWAVAGASAFRWQPGGEVTEFSLYAGPADYPVWSDSLHGIYQAPDGRILLVASNNAHLSYRNRALKGGLFEFDGTRFVPSTLNVAGSWFATSLTPQPDGSAILGTNRGFARLAGESWTEFRNADDRSYTALRDAHPALYLGTRGVQLGEDLWLYGSAAGVVARKGETWFYPDRLNWMLPDQDYASYGARVVHALETDPQGRVYIATDAGVTVYDPRGAGPEAFLISQAQSEFAFAAFEQGRMRAVNDVLIDALPPDSEAGKLAANFRKSARAISALEEKLDLAVGEDAARKADLERQILRAKQRDLALLGKLEKENPSLFNMLQLNPMDLRGFARKLPDGVVVAQYLPAGQSLYINLVSREGETLREVKLDPKLLDARARQVAQALAGQARGQMRGFDMDQAPDPAPSAPAAPATPTEALAIAAQAGAIAAGEVLDTETALGWLYDQLLRPIENDIPEGASLVVSPAGALSYLPFAALIREIGPRGPVYAVERFDLAVAPSLYALDTMIGALPSAGFAPLVFGDPDGSLPAAKAEAETVAGLLEAEGMVELRLGEEATYEELQGLAPDAPFVHLATHGKLNPTSPKDSYLLLAGKRHMDLAQIMSLAMPETELVFLSACESGIGADGLEYRTLSHAFVLAGARAVIATLWQVDDAATRKLAESFYAKRLEGAGNAAALSAAQRAMIAAGGDHARPGYWAGLTLFGAP